MTARTTHHCPATEQTTPTAPAAQPRMIPSGSAVMAVVVRVAGVVPARLDLTHVGTPEQQLGLSLGTVLVCQVPGLVEAGFSRLGGLPGEALGRV